MVNINTIEKKKIQLVENFSPRIYQQTIFNNSVNKNSLVVLPTGLGKTIIALLLATYYFNKTNKKILFLAPTKPLVEQHESTFRKFIRNSGGIKLVVLTGKVQPKNRVQMYKDSDIIFATPQVIENDLINNYINPEEFSLVIFDEAHRATGDYSYVFIAREFNKFGVKNLAITASPGSDLDKIKEIIENLYIENLEIKSEDDPDVKPYLFNKKIIEVKVSLPEEFKIIKKKLNNIYNSEKHQLETLLNVRVGNSKKEILLLLSNLRAEVAKNNINDNIWSAISKASLLLKLYHLIELFETQEISVVYDYINKLFKESQKVKASGELFKNKDFLEVYDLISKLQNGEVKHPKLFKLKTIVLRELEKNDKQKIIVFAQYRDSAIIIKKELEGIRGVNPIIFVGQAKKEGIGLSQKEQRKILDEFKNGTYNILISTSIGEEGLDIPNVDVVIFYESIPSAIRTIQRIGRTGRFSEGKIYMLLTEGTRDTAYKYVAKKKERDMYSILKRMLLNKSSYLFNNKRNSKFSNNLNTNNNNYSIDDINDKNNMNNIISVNNNVSKVNEDNNVFRNQDTDNKTKIENNTNKSNLSIDKINWINEHNSVKRNNKDSIMNTDTEVKTNKDVSLINFLGSNNNKNSVKKGDNFNNIFHLEFSNKIKEIIVDTREDNLLKKKLLEKNFKIVSKNLEIGDIVINKDIGIERKTSKDFVNSIIDNRLFNQISNLSTFFKKPLLILEETENIYSIRNIPKKSIDSIIVTLLVDFRVPIIFTKSIDETVEILNLIYEKYNKSSSIKLPKKKLGSENEELEFFISNIPGINLKSSKMLLNNFKNIKNIVNSSKEDIELIDGFGKKKSESLINFFNREYKNL